MEFKWLNESAINITGDRWEITAPKESAFFVIYDSFSIMAMRDSRNWAKACFELTDFNTHAVVSVVTKEEWWSFQNRSWRNKKP